MCVTGPNYCHVINIKEKMDGLIIALIAFCMVLLVIALTFILSNNRHKQRMMLLEKGKDPNFFDTPEARRIPLKWGMLLVGMGVGFLTAFILDTYFFVHIKDTEPLYPGMVFLFGGLGLTFFHYFLARE